MDRSRRARTSAAPMLAVVVALATVIGAAWAIRDTGDAAAVDGPPLPAQRVLDTWQVKDLNATTTLPDWDVMVWDFVEIGDRMFVGGRFQTVRRGPGSTEHAQAYLAAFDMATGTWIPDFRPTLDDGVYSLAATPDGRLLVGGEFTNVNGAPNTSSLAALDPITGEVDPGWVASVTDADETSTVMDIEVHGDDVYIGGIFDHVTGSDGTPHRQYRVARLAAASGDVDLGFSVRAAGGRVFAMAIPPDGSRLYLGGFFSSVNEEAGTKWFSAVDLDTQAVVPIDPVQQLNPNARDWVFDLAATNDRVWVAVERHQLFVFDADTMVRWRHYHTAGHGGDPQALHFDTARNVVWAGGHFHGWERDLLNNPEILRQVQWVTAYDEEIIEPIDDWLSPLGMLDGVWTLQVDSEGKLWVGGDPSSAGVDSVRGFAVFPVSSPEDIQHLGRAGAATQSTTGLTNMSWRGRTAETRCLDLVGPAGAANDGKLAGGTWECSISSTAAEAEPWWQVDLGEVRRLDTVRIWNVTDDNYEGDLHDVRIFVSDNPIAGATVAEIEAAAGVSTWAFNDVLGWHTTIEPGRTGRYVRVMLADTGETRQLRLAEVEVLHDPTVGTALVSEDAAWSYDDSGTVGLAGWRDAGFDAGGWSSGPAQLGRGDGDEQTVVGTAPGTRFRHEFDVADPTAFDRVTAALVRDDGYVMWVNGVEVGRGNVPAGEIDVDTHAIEAIFGGAEREPVPVDVPAAILHAGTNVVAVQVHDTPGSSDLSFALSLEAHSGQDTGPPSAPADLAAVVAGQGVELTWTGAVDDGPVVHHVVRDGVRIGSTVGSTWTDSDPTPGVTHNYVIEAVDGARSSVASPSIDVVIGAPPEVWVESGATWLYDDQSTDPGATWNALGFDDAAWGQGAAPLGFGDADIVTSTAQERLTTWFRHDFTLPATFPAGAELRLIADDAAAVYFNGEEVVRHHLPAGPLTPDTAATADVFGAAERTWTTFVVPTSALRSGANVVAVEVHNNWRRGGDLALDLELAPTEEVPPAEPVELVPFGGTWRYLDNGAQPAASWTGHGFDDGAWSAGAAQLGYGDGDEATTIAEGPDGTRSATAWFRHTFDVDDPAVGSELLVELVRDDGAVVYVNGTELVRNNLPDGVVDGDTLATDFVWGSAESTAVSFVVPADVLVAGQNVVAVEVHQASLGSRDLSFDLRMVLQ